MLPAVLVGCLRPPLCSSLLAPAPDSSRFCQAHCLQMCREFSASLEPQQNVQKLKVPAPPFLPPHAAAAARVPPVSPVHEPRCLQACTIHPQQVLPEKFRMGVQPHKWAAAAALEAAMQK